MSETDEFSDEFSGEGVRDPEELRPRTVKPRKPVFRVRRLTETGEDPLVAKFDTREEARRYVEVNHPRGREVYVQHPNGYSEHHSADLVFQGHADGGWLELSEDEVE